MAKKSKRAGRRRGKGSSSRQQRVERKPASPARKGFRVSSSGLAWRMDGDPQGWIALSRPFQANGDRESVAQGLEPLDREVDLLAAHSNWAGPVKLLDTGNGVVQRIDICLSGDRGDFMRALSDKEVVQGSERLLSELNGCAIPWFSGLLEIPDWEPPAAETLREWLDEAGQENAIDEEGNLRLTLKRFGFDGQIRIVRRRGLLRFCMPLGSWVDLDPPVEAAMTRLANEANTGCRLTRIAWLRQGNTQSCEAQVDLSGLPLSVNCPPGGEDCPPGGEVCPPGGEDCPPGGEVCPPVGEIQGPSVRSMWRGTIQMALHSLDLTLRRLALELPLLAETSHRSLAQLLSRPSGTAGLSRHWMRPIRPPTTAVLGLPKAAKTQSHRR
jgi:hypothetical protein